MFVTTGQEAPLASGSLAETPFAHLMLYLYRQGGDGTLHVRSGSGAEALVRIQNGRASAARTTELGSALMQALLPACGFTGEFAFYAGDYLELAEGALANAITISGTIDPYALLYASLRDHARDDMVDGVLARYPHAKLSLPADRDVGRLGLAEHDQAVVDMLRLTPATVDQIIMTAPLPGLHTRRLLYALLVTHMLAPEETRARDIYKSQADQEPPSARAPETPVTSSPRVTMSGTEAGADGRSMQPRIVIQRPVPGTVNEVASATMPAWQRLMSMRPPAAGADPRSTGQSLRPMSPPRGSITPNLNDPAARRRRAEQHMQGGRFADALLLIDELVAAEGTDAKLHGLRARALFEVHRTDRHGLPKAVLEAAKKAHELDPDEANAYFVRGLIYKQGGETQKAIACWKRTLQTDPKHIEAEREIRIALMRK